MVLGLAAGIALPMIWKATGADKILEREIKKGAKQLGFKKGGMVRHTGKAIVHKGEFVLTKAQTDKLKKMAKAAKTKPKPKKSKK